MSLSENERIIIVNLELKKAQNTFEAMMKCSHQKM